MKLAVVSLCGGKAEREALRFSGNHGIRAQMLLTDTLNTQNHGEGIKAVCITGMNYTQKAYVDSVMSAHGFDVCCMSPMFSKVKDKYRYSQLTAAYCHESLKASNIRYVERSIPDLRYRYAAFTIPNGRVNEVRVMHIPCCDAEKPCYSEQLSRKQRFLTFERTLEQYEKRKGKRGIISCGDWNTDNGESEAQKIFDSLPYTKLLNEPTWNDAKLDNALISEDLKGYVCAYTNDFRVGITSDHKTVLIDIDD